MGGRRVAKAIDAVSADLGQEFAHVAELFLSFLDEGVPLDQNLSPEDLGEFCARVSERGLGAWDEEARERFCARASTALSHLFVGEVVAEAALEVDSAVDDLSEEISETVSRILAARKEFDREIACARNGFSDWENSDEAVEAMREIFKTLDVLDAAQSNLARIKTRVAAAAGATKQGGEDE